jgi:MYXO-CTERM domain-containing protein
MLSGGTAHGQTVYVLSGSNASNSVPQTYDALLVSGTDNAGNRSTYTADATLTLGSSFDSLEVSQSGLFVANADVIAFGNVLAREGGSIRLDSGTMTAPALLLSGSGAFARTSGGYGVGAAQVSGSAALDFRTGDSITSSLSGSSGAAITIQAPLTLTGQLALSGTGSTLATNGNDVVAASLALAHGASITRPVAGTITAGFFAVDGATLEVRAGDAFVSFTQSAVSGGGSVANSGAVAYESLVVTGEGSSYSANAALTLGSSLSVLSGGLFTANADVNAVGTVSASGGGTILLATGTLSASTLQISGSGALGRTGGRYAVNEAVVSGSAGLAFEAGDVIAHSLTLTSGGVATIDAPLTLYGTLAATGNGSTLVVGDDVVTDFLSLASGATVVRTGPGTITAAAFQALGASFTIQAGDSFTGATYSLVAGGGTVANAGAVSLDSLYVSDAASAYAADAPLTLTGSAQILRVDTGSRFTANASVTGSGSIVVFPGGILELVSGTLTANELSLTGSGAFDRSGGNLAIGGLENDGLTLFGGATLAIEPGDTLMGAVAVGGTGSLLTANRPLDLDSLVLFSGGQLLLASFSGTWNGQPIALSLFGNETTTLEAYRTSNLLLFANNPDPVSFVYDFATNKTYVTAVPEPSTWAMGLAGLVAAWGWRRRGRRSARGSNSVPGLALGLAAGLFAAPASAVPIQWVTVGDAGNAGQAANGRGAVDYEYRIMKHEWTNDLYARFLNAIDPDGTNPNGIWSASMGSDARGGIAFTSGTTAGLKYGVRADMGDKPVTFVTWFDAARVANWLHNGGLNYATSDASAGAPQNTGAYTLGTATTGDGPEKNGDARFYVPTLDEWYKAAFYKGSGTNAGYWQYATRFDADPTPISADAAGNGLAGGAGNTANFAYGADWNELNGNVTTVGSNGGPSAYGTFDQNANVREWIDDGTPSFPQGSTGGGWRNDVFGLNVTSFVSATSADDALGFRLASPVAVPEPSTWAIALGGVACVGWGGWLRRIGRPMALRQASAEQRGP